MNSETLPASINLLTNAEPAGNELTRPPLQRLYDTRNQAVRGEYYIPIGVHSQHSDVHADTRLLCRRSGDAQTVARFVAIDGASQRDASVQGGGVKTR